MQYDCLKRFFDLVIVILMIILLLPVFGLVALLVLMKLGKPILFLQKRPGKNGKPFKLIKFRSMTNAKNADGSLLPNAERLTPFGRVLRSTSLDELPSLINVLKGDMSLVGPRPLLMDYLPLYNEFQKRRMEVKPGITGWAQVNGRNTLSWDEKFKLDVWYVDNRSFWLDIKILWLTLIKVLKREGISPVGKDVMPRFTGNENK
ncbi:MAG TPA: sugar transferase [Chitinophagaceae bacterium]|nr:sugar transferase [Chitinophagaceae bacterium]